MAPIALQTTSELDCSGVKDTITKTAPSIVANGISTKLNQLRATDIIFTRNQAPKAVPEPNSPAVQALNVCTDHMVTCQWTSTTGWAAPQLKPYGPLSLMPTASVLHYATEYVLLHTLGITLLLSEYTSIQRLQLLYFPSTTSASSLLFLILVFFES